MKKVRTGSSLFLCGLLAMMVQLAPARATPIPSLQPFSLVDGETRLAFTGGLDPQRLWALAPGTSFSVIKTWRENNNAWSYHFAIALLQAPDGKTRLIGFDPLPVGKDNDKALRDHLIDTPHTGEDALLSFAFAQSTDPHDPGLFLVEALRHQDGPVPDPAPASLYYFRLVASDGDPGWTPLYFRYEKTVDLPGQFVSSDDALEKAFPHKP
ncbi:hypothetical protein [Asaia spathodeae]|uniref:Uncharacterized protein n=1 Tax=Asaia spathodeae TaxID=657016 RepID=A0ABX2P4K8_9PROT|nr:hypothetical protein [Asaia spathodeae]GBR11455.1 hypothetical protein AA105894_0201 [Asaia spathodeae NBRC 105894]